MAANPPAPPSAPDTPAAAIVVVKKYANRRLYNTETSSYITLDNLAEMIRAGRDFVVYDAKSGDDITRGVLTQIIVEEESKGSAMLPTAFLRQLIGLYGGNLQGVVPRYLEHTMSSFARQQQQMRQVMERTISPFLPMGVEEMNRQNIAMFERAISMWNPFHRPGDATDQDPAPDLTASSPERVVIAPAAPNADAGELARLQHEIESLQRQLAAAHAAAVPASLDPLTPHVEIPANVLADPSGNGPRSSRRATRAKTAQTVAPANSVPSERSEAGSIPSERSEAGLIPSERSEPDQPNSSNGQKPTT